MSNSNGPLPLPVNPVGGGVTEPELPMDKSLQKENKRLKGDIKQMEMKIKAMQVECTKSSQMKERLEGLCRELQKQNKYIKAESSSKIQEANARGKELASEVQNNMGFMKSINENLAAISSESLTVKRENEELAKKIAILKGHYEEREQILQEALKETNESLQKAKIDMAETHLKGAEEKEKLIGEMQKLADALLQSREQLKDAKQTELSLRGMLQNYDEKFNGLQKALKDTNGSYEEFRSEMTKVSTRTKELEKETTKWQRRWEESNISLQKMRENYARVQDDLVKSQENLDKMKTLCRSLHTENRDLQLELKGQQQHQQGKGEVGSGDGSTDPASEGITGLTPSAEATLAAINTEVAAGVGQGQGSIPTPTPTVPAVAVAVAPPSEEKAAVKPNQNQSSPKKDNGKNENKNNNKSSPAAAVAKPVDVEGHVTDKAPEVITTTTIQPTPQSPVKDANGNAPEVTATPTPRPNQDTPTAPPQETLSPPIASVPTAATAAAAAAGGGRSPSPAAAATPPPGDTSGSASDSGSKGKKNKNKKKNKK